MITGNHVAREQWSHCVSAGYLRDHILSSPAFLRSCWHVNIYMLKQKNLQCLGLAYDSGKATPWPFCSGIFVINNVLVSMPSPCCHPVCFQNLFALSVLQCVSIILMTLLLVLSWIPYSFSQCLYYKVLCRLSWWILLTDAFPAWIINDCGMFSGRKSS